MNYAAIIVTPVTPARNETIVNWYETGQEARQAIIDHQETTPTSYGYVMKRKETIERPDAD